MEEEGFRIDMAESRDRFLECADMILTDLKRGSVEYGGRSVPQPRRNL